MLFVLAAFSANKDIYYADSLHLFVTNIGNDWGSRTVRSVAFFWEFYSPGGPTDYDLCECAMRKIFLTKYSYFSVSIAFSCNYTFSFDLRMLRNKLPNIKHQL